MQQIGSKGCWIFWDMLTHMIFETFPSYYCSPGTSQWKTQTKTANLSCINANMEVCIKLSKSDWNEDKAGVWEIWESCDYTHTVVLTTQQLTPSLLPSPSLEHELEKLHCPLPLLPLSLFLPLSLPLPVMLYQLVKVQDFETPLLENLLPLPRWQLGCMSIKHIVKDISIHLGFQEVWRRKE